MFEDSLLESSGRLKSGRQKYTTAISFVIQMMLIGVLVLIPLIYTEALPRQQLMTFLVAPPPPPPPPPPPAAVAPRQVVKVETEVVQGQLRQPTKIPEKVQMVNEQEAPPAVGGAFGVVGGIGSGEGGAMGGVIGGIIASTPVAVPKAVVPQKVRVSQGVAQGLLVREVKPNYPPLARQARVQGAVVLQAVISKDGSIQNLRVVSGHPMLVQSAMDAVKQWRYKPYFLNGEPVEVETSITVNFTLAG
ncbi:MAG: energy transducer TonB [Candidatus Korobacteraceae bacterium]